MSIESVIVDILNSLNPRCTNSSFAGIAKIHSRPRVEAGLCGREPFDNETSLKYLSVARKMKSLSESVGIPIDWTEVEQIRTALDSIENGTLRIASFKNEPADTEKNEPHFYIFLGAQYFAGRRPTVLGRFEVISTPYSGRAVCMTEDCTARVISALTKMGHRAQRVPCKIINPDNSFDKFDRLWGGPEETVQQ